jgi:hypothetical protein
LKGKEMRLILILTIIISIAFLAGCKNGSEPTIERTPAIYGSVKDSSGNPISGANIYLYYTLNSTQKQILTSEDSSINFPNPFYTQTEISFDINNSSNVNIYTVEEAFKDTNIILTGFLNQGTYMWQIDFVSKIDSLLLQRPGIYELFIENGSNKLHRKMFHQVQKYETTDPYTVTDNEGKFVIPYNKIPVGFITQRIAESGQLFGNSKVSDTITIRAVNWNLQKGSVLNIIVDTTKVQDVNLIF